MVISVVVDEEDDCKLLELTVQLETCHNLINASDDCLSELLLVLVGLLRIVNSVRLNVVALHANLFLTVNEPHDDLLCLLCWDLTVMHQHDASLSERLAVEDGHLFEKSLVAKQLFFALVVK